MCVCWHSVANKWVANIHFNNRTQYIGLFEDEIEAAKAYDYWADTYFGEFAKLNFPKPLTLPLKFRD